jgi:carboxyl-terminal processing protease
MPLWEVEERLVGAPGTRVELELIRLGETRQVSFDLRPFDPPPVAFEESAGEDPVGVLRIARFEPATVAAARQALERAAAEGRERLLVDLRGVAGGDAAAAYGVGELFARGELGGLERKGNRLESFGGDAEPVWRGELVVLVSRGTLGAAEVLAAVLRQKAGAELVGERTFGWAGRQESADLASGARLFFTDAFYTGPDGEPLSRSLEPDLLVDAAGRGFREQDEPLGDLILEKGLERLRERAAEAGERKAA